MKEYRRKKEEGVSPVIATILMVAITVVLAATLYLMVGNMNQSSTTTPPIQFANTQKIAKNNTSATWTTSISSQALNPTDLKFAIKKADGTYLATGVDFPTATATAASGTGYSVTWYDANGDGKVDTGDTVTIYVSEGTLQSSYTFEVVAGATGSASLTT